MDDGQGGDFLALVGQEGAGDSLATLFTVTSGLQEGGLYRFRFRARNVNGWSGWSPIAYLRAASGPGRPGAPTLNSVAATGFTLAMTKTGEDGGGSIVGYELWRNQGTGTVDFIQVTTYDGQSSTHTVTVAADTLVAGQIYLLKSRAVNAFGSGEYSEELAVGVADFPAAPASLTKVIAESSPTYITLEWAASADTELPVLGYRLSMRNDTEGDETFTVVYDGLNYPNVHKYTVASGVETGSTYSFQVEALNYNGAGAASATATYALCTSPSVLSAPTLEAVTATSMTLNWDQPGSDGGCQVLSYSVYMDDGAGGSFSELDPAAINNKPTLRTFVVSTFTSSDTSKTYKFKIMASNLIGSVESPEVSFVLAAVPDKPTTAPTLNLAATSASRIGVDYAAFTVAMNGGSAVLSYELQMYNYTSSSWLSLVGGASAYTIATSFTQEQGLEKGSTYMFRYRAWNINGAGEFSDVSYLVAAQVPARPPSPRYGSSSASAINLLFSPSSDDGGSMILRMELEVSPLLSTSWTAVATYDGSSMRHELTTAADGLVAYSKYRFRIRAVNAYGPSADSAELVASVAPLPGVFAAVTKDQLYSSTTSIMVRWAVPVSEVEPILGFRLRMTDAATQETKVIYDNPSNQNVLEFLADGLTPGGTYSFSVLGVNFNGEGALWSPDATFRACTAPSGVAVPALTEQSATQLSFSWQAPAVDGGCPTTTYELWLDNKVTGLLEQTYTGAAHVMQTTVSISATYLGQNFRYLLKAVNDIGSGSSLVGYALFAAVPNAPSAGPASDATITNKERIKVTWAALGTAETGGSEIESYQL